MNITAIQYFISEFKIARGGYNLPVALAAYDRLMDRFRALIKTVTDDPDLLEQYKMLYEGSRDAWSISDTWDDYAAAANIVIANFYAVYADTHRELGLYHECPYSIEV
jgi:hypothetical protein